MVKGVGFDLAEHAEAQGELQKETQERLREFEKELDGWLEKMCAVNMTLRDKLRSSKKISREAAPRAKPATSQALARPASAAVDDYKASIEKLLQGSLDALGDKLSDRIMNMLKEVKNLGGSMREAKMAEIRDAAQAERVDLASLFLYEKVESNLGKEGLKVDEKKSRGIGSILEKLKKMKGGQDAGKTGRV